MSFNGLTPGVIGLYQINVVVPAAAPAVVIELTVEANFVTSNTDTLDVR